MTGLDPDQLLKSLDAQITVARARRSQSHGSNRVVIRTAGILFLVLGMGASLLALQYAVSEFAAGNRAPVAQRAQPAAGDRK